jgi:hypothetical protein
MILFLHNRKSFAGRRGCRSGRGGGSCILAERPSPARASPADVSISHPTPFFVGWGIEDIKTLNRTYIKIYY